MGIGIQIGIEIRINLEIIGNKNYLMAVAQNTKYVTIASDKTSFICTFWHFFVGKPVRVYFLSINHVCNVIAW